MVSLISLTLLFFGGIFGGESFQLMLASWLARFTQLSNKQMHTNRPQYDSPKLLGQVLDTISCKES